MVLAPQSFVIELYMFEKVGKFVYLESLTSNDNDTELEIKRCNILYEMFMTDIKKSKDKNTLNN